VPRARRAQAVPLVRLPRRRRRACGRVRRRVALAGGCAAGTAAGVRVRTHTDIERPSDTRAHTITTTTTMAASGTPNTGRTGWRATCRRPRFPQRRWTLRSSSKWGGTPR
jgi:hypothetical protein